MVLKEFEIIEKSLPTVEELRKHLNLDVDLVDSDYLGSIIEAAVEWCENRINCFIMPTNAKLKLSYFTGSVIVIDKGGVNSIQSILVNNVAVTGYKVNKKVNSTEITLTNSIGTESDIEVLFSAGGNVKSFIHACIINTSDLFDT